MLSLMESMIDMAPPLLRARREARGLSQVALADAADLSRQSVGAIEAGRTTPAVDVALRLARALDCTVEDLFGEASPAHLAVEPAAPTRGRVALAFIAGRWVAHPLHEEGLRISADALIVPAPARRAAGSSRRAHADPVRPLAEARDNLVLMGCAPALGLLADRLNARPGPGRFLWLPRASTAALDALARGHAHVAGVHLIDERSGEANLPDVRRHAGPGATIVTALARWQVGLVAPAGNPRKLRGPADLGRRGLRVVTREPGAGARRLLDRELRRVGVRPARSVPARGHLEVAQAIALGVGDVGVATHDAAAAFGLHFIPLTEERYDLAIPQPLHDDPRVHRLLDTLTAAAFRRELTALGYDVSCSGDRIAEVQP